MHRRSQGDEDLAEFHPDITALERSNRRGANRGSARDSDEDRMEFGEGTSGGNATHNSPAAAAEGTGEPRSSPRVQNNPPRRNPPARAVRYDDNGDNVRIGTFDEPGIRSAKTGIVAPRIPVNNFEMKQGLMNAVRSLQFHGRPSDNPLDHLDTFDRLCSMYKVNNVPLDVIRMMMFPFSLADGANVWEREIPSELVSTWDDVKKEFLTAFFPKQKTAKIRGDIASFKQRSHESFAQAWDRMRRYIRGCPHHGFSRDSILGIFYRGCDAATRMHLDSASGGCFANNTVKEGENIIMNLAKSNSQNYDDEDDYDRDDETLSSDAKALKEMHRKLDLVLKSQANRKEVSFVGRTDRNGEYDEEDFDDNEEMNYIENNQGFQNRGYPNQTYNNQPFRSNYGGQGGGMQPQRFNGLNQGNPRTFNSNNNFNSNQPRPFNGNGGNYQRPPFQSNQYGDSNSYQNRNTNYSNLERLEKLENLITKSMEESNKMAIEHRKKIDALGESLNRRMDGWDEKLDQMNSRVLILERNVADVTSSIKLYKEEAIPGKQDHSLKDFCQYMGRSEDSARTETPNNRYVSFTTNEILPADPSSDFEERSMEEFPRITPPPQDRPPSPFPDTLDRARKQARAYADIVRALNIMESTEELHQMLAHDREFGRNVARMKEHKEWYEERSHTFPIQTRGNHNTHGDLDQIRYVMEKLHEGEQCDEWEKKNTNILEGIDRCRPEDPKCFILPCFINGMAFRKCVLDLGASKSIMPLDVARAIGITNFEKTETCLVLADWTSRRTAGLVRNVPITFEGHTVTTDFLILDTQRGGPGRVILGRPFLEYCNANFDAKQGIVSFRFGDNCRCCVFRDWDVNAHGGEANISVMRFFQYLALETRKRAACLGGISGIGKKHRIVELVEEYESSQLYIPERVDTHNNFYESYQTNQGEITSDPFKQLRNEDHNPYKERRAMIRDHLFGSNFSKKNRKKGLQVFEWRVKSDLRASNGETSHEQSDSVQGEIQPSQEQSPRETEGTDIPRGDEIEPGDAGTQRQESPPPSS